MEVLSSSPADPIMDVVTAIRFVYASAFALQCCSVLLLRRLEAIAATRYVSLTDSAKKRRTIIELVVGLLLPILYVALAIINQGHRYDIIEDFGPTMSIYPSVLSIVFSTVPTLLASVVATLYACKSQLCSASRGSLQLSLLFQFLNLLDGLVLCAYWLFLRRRQLSAVLSSSGSGINISQYVRLFALSCMEILWTVPVNWTLQMQNIFNRSGSILYPYQSWAYVHYGYWRVWQYSLDDLRQTAVGRRNLPIMYLGSMSIAVSCFLFFGFLGTSTEISRDLASRLRAFYTTFKPASRASERPR